MHLSGPKLAGYPWFQINNEGIIVSEVESVMRIVDPVESEFDRDGPRSAYPRQIASRLCFADDTSSLIDGHILLSKPALGVFTRARGTDEAFPAQGDVGSCVLMHRPVLRTH